MKGNLASSQTKIDLFDEVNFELSKEELQEAVKLSGYTKQDKKELTEKVDDKKLTSTQRMWMFALSGIWKTMMDVDGWKLPASFNKYNICGKGYFKICSPDNFVKGLSQAHDFVRKFVYHCGRIGCEICAKRAGARTAKKIERRIWLYGLRIKHITKGRRSPLPSHIIEAIDPKSDFWNWHKQKQTDALKKIRKLVGLSGGAEINHLWAFDKSNMTPFYRPHKHLIVFGWLKSNASELVKKEFGIDLVYHKVRDGTLYSRLDVFAVAFYQLSHCAVKHNKHSIKWFGNLSYNKISNKTLEKFKDEEYALQDDIIEKTKCCDFCQEKLIPAEIDMYCKDWRAWMPPPDKLEAGCGFSNGLFVVVDFYKGEKMPYYDENFELTYKKTKKEQKELQENKRPDLYNKKTNNQDLFCFMNASHRS